MYGFMYYNLRRGHHSETSDLVLTFFVKFYKTM